MSYKVCWQIDSFLKGKNDFKASDQETIEDKFFAVYHKSTRDCIKSEAKWQNANFILLHIKVHLT